MKISEMRCIKPMYLEKNTVEKKKMVRKESTERKISSKSLSFARIAYLNLPTKTIACGDEIEIFQHHLLV